MGTIVYAGRLFYEPSRIHAAAVYCSDGRLGDHFDDFLQNGLHLPRYDRLALPGGPAALLGTDSCPCGSAAAWEALAFLVQAHELTRVLLVAHEGCAFYAQRLSLKADCMEARQRRDIESVAAKIRASTPQLRIDAYFARITGNRITFEEARTCMSPSMATA